jgi:hypothetical protein
MSTTTGTWSAFNPWSEFGNNQLFGVPLIRKCGVPHGDSGPVRLRSRSVPPLAGRKLRVSGIERFGISQIRHTGPTKRSTHRDPAHRTGTANLAAAKSRKPTIFLLMHSTPTPAGLAAKLALRPIAGGRDRRLSGVAVNGGVNSSQIMPSTVPNSRDVHEWPVGWRVYR